MIYICAMPLVTFTSDLGSQYYTLSSVKGKLHELFSNTQIIDIAHDLKPFNQQQTAYIFKQSYRNFPPNTYHFLFHDIYANEKQQLLYVYENQQHIFCADNGFLTMLFDDKPFQIFKLDDIPTPYNILTVADTFMTHMNLLEQGNRMGLISVNVADILIQQPNKAFYKNNTLEAQVLFIDAYGNVILNVTRTQFEEARAGRTFKILFMRDDEIHTLSKHYNDVPINEKLCLFNTADYLEIAVNKGNAAKLFGFQASNDRSLFYNNIKLFFE
jgi:S-adenosyl-L-methionine hydrolase (adenosine-forming)